MYKYRTALIGHSADVRGVTAAVCPADSIVTCSRDNSARLWTPDSDGQGYTCVQQFGGHDGYVSCACALPPSEEFPQGLILTGGHDHVIHVYSTDKSQPLFKLTGHSGTVSALAAGKFGTVVSGSWDCTARVWLGQKCLFTLTGHQAAVWAVAILPGAGLVITGSADKTLIAWKTGQSIRKFTGHDDCVRGLAVLSEEEFVSCSNDATLRRWHINGECLQVLYGHTNFVYSVALMANGCDLVSSGEDRTVRVWRSGTTEPHQTIRLPAQSVWSVTCLQNGDIAAGSSDGVCRIFSAVEERQAPAHVQETYEQEISSTQLNKADLGGYKVSDLPGVEALLAPGRRDGQTVMVRDGQTVTCHSWSQADQQWHKIGDVVGAAGGNTESSGKVLHDGKEYDYVFSVDIQEGAPPLKLPYNVSEDPWTVAQRFIHQHQLSQQFLEQVANFIITNSGQAGGRKEAGSGEYYDPFTGGSRYVPGSGPARPAAPASSPAQPAVSTASKYFPQTEYLLFDKGNVEGMATKLREFNQRTGDGSHRLEETALLELTKLAEPAAEPPSPAQITNLLTLLDWPRDLAFPAVDLLRLAVRNRHVCDSLCLGDRLPQLLAALSRHTQPEAPVNNQLLALRAAANLFSHESGRAALTAAGNQAWTAPLSLLPTSNRAIQVAAATVLLNLAVKAAAGGGTAAEALSALGTALQALTDPEARFRALVGLGTLLSSGRTELTTLARSLQLDLLLTPLTQVSEPVKLAECAAGVNALLNNR